MFGPEHLGKLLLTMGGFIALVGAILLLSGRFGIGRFPGDIFVQRKGFILYFPITTTIIISIILTILLKLLFRR